MEKGQIGFADSREVWWAHQDLNLEPTDYESAALTVELWARSFGFYIVRASLWSPFADWSQEGSDSCGFPRSGTWSRGRDPNDMIRLGGNLRFILG